VQSFLRVNFALCRFLFEKQTLSIPGNCRLLPATKSPSGYLLFAHDF